MKRFAWAVAGLSLYASLQAQNPTQILDRVARTYTQLQSLRVESQMTVQMATRGGGSEMKFTTRATLQASMQRPNLLRMTIVATSKSSSGTATIRLFSDGKQVSMQLDELKQVMQQAAPKTLSELLQMGVISFLRPTAAIDPALLMMDGNWRKLVANPKLVQRERLGNRPVYKLTVQVKPSALKEIFPASPDGKATQTLWIGVQDNLIWKSEMTVSVASQGMRGTVRFTETYTRQEKNPKLTPATFAYKVPAGYKVVDSFSFEASADTAELLKGKPAEDFALQSLEGKQVRLADYKGKIVVLNLFAHWCGPCRREAPELEKDIWQAYREREVVVLGVATWAQDNPQQRAEEFAREFKLSFPVLVDAENKVVEQYQVGGVPTTFIIDKQGVIREVVVGADVAKIKQTIETLLKEATPQGGS